ncbi:zinc ribbon domain-containing protein [Streptosporangium sp. G11]|uniref:Zn-ribbon domain-containing OB-fold protein n=1 Tax=Streptosporangium sp. G11 TaxID=3436926 RepID=UPI003EBF9057
MVASGSYTPSFSVRRGRRRVLVVNGDEDAVTLAIEAAQDCLTRYEGPVDELHLALARPELVNGPQAEIVREAIGLDAGVTVSVSAGDSLAGLAALAAATNAVQAGRVRSVLLVATEPGDSERVSAGAVAVLVAGSDAPALRPGAQRSVGDVVYGNWIDGDGVRHLGDGRYLDRYVADHAKAALAALIAMDGLPPAAVTGVAATAVAIACGSDRSAVLPDRGVAGPLLAVLAAGSAATGSAATVVATTASRVVALSIEVDEGARPLLPTLPGPVPELPEPIDVRSSPPLSLPGSSPFFRRSARELLRLEGARCDGCGHVVFPPSQRTVCPSCHGYGFTPAPLSRIGRVYTYVVNRFLPTGFGDQMILVLAELDDGSRYWAPTSGMSPDEVEIGAGVELRVRRFTDDGGAPVYAMKFVPPRTARDGAGSAGATTESRDVA